jgi:transcriptional regulator with GAF, ATPase, and Fis domain
MKFVRLDRSAPLAPPMVDDPFDRYGIVGRSRAVADVIRRIELVSATRSTVLITGETGTGKELVARAVHNRSAQRNLPFIKVNCAAIPETLLESELFGHVRGAFTDATGPRKGKFSLAHRGSIFLDEIGTMSPGLQAKLLRVLQEREIDPLGAERTEHVDVRVIAATNRNLRQLVNEGRFQDDLFYRLHVVPIVVPPLRERIEDVPLLVEHLVAKHAMKSGRSIEALEDGVMAWLQEYHWPGNVRELENTIERAVVLTSGPTITRDVVTVEAQARATTSGVPSLKLRENVEWVECETVRLALEMSPLKRDAARLMGISPREIAYYLAKYPCIDKNKTPRARPPAFIANCPSTAPRDVANSPRATHLATPRIAVPKITPDVPNAIAACGPI